VRLVLLSTAAMNLVLLLVTFPPVVTTAFVAAPQLSFSSHHHRRRKHALAPLSESTVERASRCYTSMSMSIRTSTRLSASVDDYTAAEVEEMEQLILSISREATDPLRRDRLRAIFIEALSQPNGDDPQRFIDLFNETLIIVGDRVKLEAQQKFLKLQELQELQEAEAVAAKDDVDNDESSLTPPPPPPDEATPEVPREKTPDELQLWALIDMMVQSKTIVKKESGDLGNKGTFA
jgi:hypothetical protein